MNIKMTHVQKRLDKMLDNRSTFHSQHTWDGGMYDQQTIKITFNVIMNMTFVQGNPTKLLK